MKKSIKIEMSIKMHEGIYCQIKLVKKPVVKSPMKKSIEVYWSRSLWSFLINQSIEFIKNFVFFINQEV